MKSAGFEYMGFCSLSVEMVQMVEAGLSLITLQNYWISDSIIIPIECFFFDCYSLFVICPESYYFDYPLAPQLIWRL